MIDYKFIGWCNEDGHDKVWGVIYLSPQDENSLRPSRWTDRKIAVFWGRRGKTLRYQTKVDDYNFWKVLDKKRQSYQSIDKNRLIEVYPEFQSDLEATAVWAKLAA